MQTQSDKRYLNFSLVMLGDTITNPQAGLSKILDYAIVAYSEKCRRPWKSALVQLLYCMARNKGTALSSAVSAISRRGDVQELAGEVDGAFIGHDAAANYPEAMLDIYSVQELPFTDAEKESLVQWLALNDAASFFGIGIRGHKMILDSAAQARHQQDAHEIKYGNDASASVPFEYFRETWDAMRTATDAPEHTELMRIFRMVCAVRSLIGKKSMVRTTKDMLRARCIGGKSVSVGQAIATNSPAIATELELLQSRKRFDRLLDVGAMRGFYSKLGIDRCIYLSTDPIETIGKAASKMPTSRAEYKRQSKTRRDKIIEARRTDTKGHQGGSIGGSIGGSFNKSFNKAIQ